MGGKSIVIPSPGSGLVEIGSDYRVVLDVLTPDTNRLVAAFVSPVDAGAIRAGQHPQLGNYALAEVARRAEFVDLDAAAFKQVTGSMEQAFGETQDATLKNQEQQFNQRLKDLNANASQVTFEKPVRLGTLFSKPDAWGYEELVPISAKGVTINVAMGVIALRVQNRLLFAYLYEAYKDTGTAQQVRATCEQWADAILSANK